MQKKGAINTIVQVALLFLVQWLSIAAIVINAMALDEVKDSNQGLIIAAVTSNPQDVLVLAMASVSLFLGSILLLIHLQISFRNMFLSSPCVNAETCTDKDAFRSEGNGAFSIDGVVATASKRVLGIEIGICILVIALWTTSTAIVTHNYNGFSSCKNQNISTLTNQIRLDKSSDLEGKISSKACSLVDAMIAVAFTAIVVWIVTLFTSIISIRNSISLSAVTIHEMFVMERPVIQSSSHDSKVQIGSCRNSRMTDPIMYRFSTLFRNNSNSSNNNNNSQDNVTTMEEIIENKNIENKSCKETDDETTTYSDSNYEKEYHHDSQEEKDEADKQKIILEKDVLKANDDFYNKSPMEKIKYLQEPKAVAPKYGWDFNFEPLKIDLVLPSKSELLLKRNPFF